MVAEEKGSRVFDTEEVLNHSCQRVYSSVD